MSVKQLPPPELLRQLLRYETDTGKLYWRERTPDMFSDQKHSAEHICNAWNSRFSGKEAFTATDSHGYKHGGLLGRQHLAHRAIWAMLHDEWPSGQIDHINGIRTDNRASNLRGVTNQENSANRKLPKNNKSGQIGVLFRHQLQKWQAVIRVNGTLISLGVFVQKTDAILARKKAEAKYGFHPNHGRCQ
jgi:hypothetical protein